MTPELTLNDLKQALSGHAAAFRSITSYQPAAGEGTKVFPPTYEGGKYATEPRRINGADVPCVLLDSVQSQANRMELALLDAWESGSVELPVITVDFTDFGLPKPIRVTSLEAPHRIADAILRDSLYTEGDGKQVLFRRSSLGRALDYADLRNATELFGVCPTSLLFGIWDSTGPRGGLGVKFQRAIVSEMIGLHAVAGLKPSSRIDPIEIVKGAGPVFRHKDPERLDGPNWTIERKDALEIGGKKVLFGLSKKKEYVFWNGKTNDQDEGKPSKTNHGNVTPSLEDEKTKQPLPGGFTISEAIQTTVISLPALRRLRFPIPGLDSIKQREANTSAQTVLAALGIYAATLTRRQGADLRSRCHLAATSPIIWESLDEPGEPPKPYLVEVDKAGDLLRQAIAEARDFGLPWRSEAIRLEPSPELVALVRRSQELQVTHGSEGGEE